MARRDENDFYFPTNRRGWEVSTGRGRFGTLPMGYHQHGIDAEAEIRPSFTVFREIYEELFGGKEVEQGKGLKHDWFFGQCEPLRWLRENCWAQPPEGIRRAAAPVLVGMHSLRHKPGTWNLLHLRSGCCARSHVLGALRQKDGQ